MTGLLRAATISERKLVGLGVVAACVSAMLVAAAHLGATIRIAQADVSQTVAAQRHLHAAGSALFDMETSQRGYLLTREPGYLDSYRQAALEEDAAMAALMQAPAVDAAWEAARTRLRALGQARRADLQRTLDRAAGGDVDGAIAFIRSGAGDGTMNRLRRVLADMDEQASQALVARRAAGANDVRRSLWGAAVLGALAAVLLAAVSVLVGRQRSAQQAAVKKARAAVLALEQEAARQQNRLERSSQALTLSEAQLAGIIDTASAAILTVDAEQRIVIANRAAAHVFGVSRDELIGSSLERWIPARFRAHHAHDLRNFGEGKGGARRMGHLRDVVALRANGEEFPIDAAISHLRSDGHEWFTVVLQDISERRRSEASLQASNSKFEVALASMNDAVLIVDSDGRFREFNDAFATVHRFKSRAECLQTLAEYPDVFEVTSASGELVPPDQWALSRALRGETASNVEYGLRRRDTGEAWVGSYSFAPIRATDGTVVGAVAASRDVTALRAAQADLTRSHADLQALIAAQDRIQEEERKRIARELHDDLQQTLAVIRIDLSGIGDKLAIDPAGVASLVCAADQLTLAAIDSTRRIVNDLRPQMLEDLGLIAALKAMTGHFETRTGAVCSLDADEGVAAILGPSPALATCLYRVTQEALNNVAKHARATLVQVVLTEGGPGLFKLRISDDGIGMRTGARHGPESFGLLGMAERVRAIGGQLRIDSTVGSGTIVEVLAPVPVMNAATGVARDVESAPVRPPSRPSNGAADADRSVQAELGQPAQCPT